MSGSTSPDKAPAAQGDPSMEDILASIRRILSEDDSKPEDVPPQPAAAPAPPEPEPEPVDAAEEDDALMLDPSMMVVEAGSADGDTLPAEPPTPPVVVVASLAPPPLAPLPAPRPLAPPLAPPATLMAPEAAAAAASSVDSLVRTLATERSMLVTSGGPTIEDIVRQEIRPLLKAWLDVNLPPLVERLVRTEIERVVGRATL